MLGDCMQCTQLQDIVASKQSKLCHRKQQAIQIDHITNKASKACTASGFLVLAIARLSVAVAMAGATVHLP